MTGDGVVGLSVGKGVGDCVTGDGVGLSVGNGVGDDVTGDLLGLFVGICVNVRV